MLEYRVRDILVVSVTHFKIEDIPPHLNQYSMTVCMIRNGIELEAIDHFDVC